MTSRIWWSPYCLEPLENQQALQGRMGALLKIEFEKGIIGYADCHPWVSCGDLSLNEQLKKLKTKDLTPLLERSLYFALLDAYARADGVSLFTNMTVPASHWLAYDIDSIQKAVDEGFTHFKIKGSTDTIQFISSLSSDCKVRFDFNSQLSLKQFENFLNELGEGIQHIDYIEDPIPYDYQQWKYLQDRYNISLGSDRLSLLAEGLDEASKVLIMKPAIQKGISPSPNQRLILTSYLDHPLGQAAAAYSAAKYATHEICGLNSHRVYMSNPFSEQLSQKGPQFQIPSGNGFGFDPLLEQIRWKNL